MLQIKLLSLLCIQTTPSCLNPLPQLFQTLSLRFRNKQISEKPPNNTSSSKERKNELGTILILQDWEHETYKGVESPLGGNTGTHPTRSMISWE